MSRQDANAIFARTSFLYGANAAYIEDLYASYRERPRLGRRRVAGLFPEPEGRAKPTSPKVRAAPSWKTPNWPLLPSGDLIAALDGQWAATEKTIGEQDRSQGAGQASSFPPTDVHAGDARFHPRADADPRLPHARPSRRQARSARPRAGEAEARARSAILRLHRSRPRPPDFPRRRARPRNRDAAPDRRHPAPHLLPDSATSSCTSPTPSRRAGFSSASKAATRRSTSRREGKSAILNKLIEAEGFEKFLRREIHRHQALRPRRRRSDDSGARADHQARRQARREGDRASACPIAAG